jgi:lysozyme
VTPPVPTTPRTDGIDVSKWQGTINWPQVLGTGLKWVAMRVWDRQIGAPDPQFAANRNGAKPAKYRLLYHYLQASVPIQTQVDQYLNTVGTLQPGEGVMLDAEESGITEAMCLDWLSKVEGVTGRPSTVYTGGYVAGGTIWRSNHIFNGQRARFFAAYTSQSEALVKHAGGIMWDAWQWTDEGMVAGISTPVDCDQVDDWAAFDKVVKPTVTPQPPAQVVRVTVDVPTGTGTWTTYRGDIPRMPTMMSAEEEDEETTEEELRPSSSTGRMATDATALEEELRPPSSIDP